MQNWRSTRCGVSPQDSSWRVGDFPVGRMPRCEIELRRFLETEGHSAFSSLDLAEQNGFATGDRNFFASHAHVFESHVGQVPNHESILRAKINGRKTMEAKSVRRADAFDRSKANRAA